MPRKNEISTVTSGETIIGAGVKVKGALLSDSDITIDGKLEGEIKATGTVHIGVNGIIKADILATNVTVGGQVRGNIEATGETLIASTGKVTGNIATSLIGIDPGAMFIGKVTMTKTEILSAEEHEANAINEGQE
mgnify:CR=1 FL=1